MHQEAETKSASSASQATHSGIDIERFMDPLRNIDMPEEKKTYAQQVLDKLNVYYGQLIQYDAKDDLRLYAGPMRKTYQNFQQLVEQLYSELCVYDKDLMTSVKNELNGLVALYPGKVESFLTTKPGQSAFNASATLRFFAEQALLRVDAHYKAMADTFFASIKTHSYNPLSPKSCFISYAWPAEYYTEDGKEKRFLFAHEAYINPFLDGLYEHLNQVGIRTILDKRSIHPDASIPNFKAQIGTTSHVLLVLSQSLQGKDKSAIDRVIQAELSEIRARHQLDQTCFNHSNIYITYVTGELETVGPPQFYGYHVVRPWREKHYLEHLRDFIEWVQYGIKQSQELPKTSNARAGYAQLWQQTKKPIIGSKDVPDLLEQHVKLWKNEMPSEPANLSQQRANGGGGAGGSAASSSAAAFAVRRSRRTALHKLLKIDYKRMNPSKSGNNASQRAKLDCALKNKNQSDVELLQTYLECYGALTYGQAGRSTTERIMRERLVWLRSHADELQLTVPADPRYKLDFFLAVIKSHVEHVYHFHRSVAQWIYNVIKSFPWFDGLEAFAEWMGFLDGEQRVEAAIKLIQTWKKSSGGGYFSVFCKAVNGTANMKNVLDDLSDFMKRSQSQGMIHLTNHIQNLQSPAAVYQFACTIACGLISRMDRFRSNLQKLDLHQCLALQLSEAFKKFHQEVYLDLDAIAEAEVGAEAEEEKGSDDIDVVKDNHPARPAPYYSSHKGLFWGSVAGVAGIAGAAAYWLSHQVSGGNHTSFTP